MMERIGVLGGTFNPIHLGHLAIAHMAQESLRLKKVIFVPAHLPPHKNSSRIASTRHRFNMVKLAIQGNPRFEISDFEIKKPGKSYTIDTLWHFRDIFPKPTQLFFIVGGDTLPQLKNWRYINDILKIATFIVVNRPGQFKRSRGIKIRHHSVSMPGIDLSSSYIRQRAALGKSIKYFVPEGVIRYIQHHQLYQSHKSRGAKND